MPPAVFTVMLAGQVIDGPVLSTKFTVNVQVLKFPLVSVARIVTTVELTPAPKLVPGIGVWVIELLPPASEYNKGVLPQASVAVIGRLVT